MEGLVILCWPLFIQDIFSFNTVRWPKVSSHWLDWLDVRAGLSLVWLLFRSRCILPGRCCGVHTRRFCGVPVFLFFSLHIWVQERLGGWNLLKYLHLVGSLKYCRVRCGLRKTMGRQLGPPCPAQKRRWLPIVCGVKSKRQAWNSSAGTIRPRPAYRTLSLAATSCPARPNSSPPEPQNPHLPGTRAWPVPQPTLALLLTPVSKLSLLPGSAQRPPLPGRPTDPSTHLDLTPTLAVSYFCISIFKAMFCQCMASPV